MTTTISNYNIEFYNKTNFKIIVETWKKINFGLSVFTKQEVIPNEKILLTESSTGEWLLSYDNLILENDFLFKNYKIQIGKFRNVCCVMGDFSWIYDEGFKIVRDNNEKITLIEK